MAPAKPARERDPVWDALVVAFGEPTNDAERGRRNRACRLVRQSLAATGLPACPPGDDPVLLEVRRRASRYRSLYPQAAFTDMALASRWGELRAPQRPTAVSSPTEPEAQRTDPEVVRAHLAELRAIVGGRS